MVMRASIWDIRDMRAAHPSPRKAVPPSVAPAAPMGSPRLARQTPAAARLSQIGRIAMRDSQVGLSHLASAHLASGGVAPGSGASESAKKLWPGRPPVDVVEPPRPGLRKVPVSADAAASRTARNTRSVGSARSASAPRAYPSTARRSGSIPRDSPVSQGSSPPRAASSLDCAIDRDESTMLADDELYGAAPHAARDMSFGYLQTGSGTPSRLHRPPPPCRTPPLQHSATAVPMYPDYSSAASRQVSASVDGCGSEAQKPHRRFAETIENLLARDATPTEMHGSVGRLSPRPSSQHSKPASAATVGGVDARVQARARTPLHGLVPYVAPRNPEEDLQAEGLGSIQPRGRAHVLLQWSRAETSPAASQFSQPMVQAQNSGGAGRPPRAPGSSSSVAQNGLASTYGRGGGGGSSSSTSGFLLRQPSSSGGKRGGEPPELEWSSLGDSAKQALRHWVAGKLGGRHCMLVVENGVGSDGTRPTALPGQDEPSMSVLRDGGALNVLSGLQAELGLMGGSEESWLFAAIFSKQPQQVLNDALAAIVAEIGDQKCRQPSDVSVEEANLALRRKAMKAQYDVGGFLLNDASTSFQGKPADECIRLQIWLELVRLHAEGVSGSSGGSSSSTAPSAQKPAAPQQDAQKGGAFGDPGVCTELGKGEADIEAESNQMSLEALRTQNRTIEDYVMRLVKRRDDLRQITKLAEERDSYYILGLDGPSVGEDAVKKAYRNLARREHPDKAGIGNKRKFQAIQQAYTAVMRQLKEGGAGTSCSSSTSPSGGSSGASKSVGSKAFSPVVLEAAEQSRRARDCADQVASCAHRILRSLEDCAEAHNMPKRKGFRILRECTTRSSAELLGAALQLKTMGESISAVAQYAEKALDEHKDNTVAGIGLRDRAVIVEDAGRSSLTSAELLEKIAEATEATLKKVEKASPDGAEGGAPRGGAARGGGENGNLLQLGVELLSESITRISAVARRSADEAIGNAMKAFELSRGLAAVDAEARKEKEKQAAKQQGFEEDVPMPAGDVERPSEDSEDKDEEKKKEEKNESQTPKAAEPPVPPTPRDQLKCAAKRVKERHVALRVKNLLFLTSLNEEALRLQGRLWALLERSSGALIPDISVLQKSTIFELVMQLLDFSLAESSRLLGNPAWSNFPGRILEKAFAFALALEHSKAVAMPADSRTQALKLAALIDRDLMCQIVNEPFRRRLLAASATAAGSGSSVSLGSSRRRPSEGVGGYGRSRLPRGSQAAAANYTGPATWEEAVQLFIGRFLEGLRGCLERNEPGTTEAGGNNESSCAS
eukprot:TRINITY_DN1579_c0_g3_i1.p1 TRINITY_DN1579_c0_g3~~TRINITY_DN1579_c0_g3_i1.p1  ORF type:complete len:1293 (+),score=279.04 TRINITY_DN1579_c0_g3_i1:127-4005(+)